MENKREEEFDIVWRSMGDGILHGFLYGNDETRIEVDSTDGLIWHFTLDNRKGEGAVMVGAGCNYNPLSLIESMWVAFESGSFSGLVPNARIQFDDKVSHSEWAGMFGDDDC